MKNTLRKLAPEFLINWYHFGLAWLSAGIYGHPSKKIKVIGITGTKGKSTVVYLAGKILEEAGNKVGWISSLSIKVADQEILNPYHLTMPGRFFIQKMLRQMVKKKCQYALIEVTSEGIKQHRHQFIDFDTVVLTNLTPEHLEAHGGFEKYKEAKAKLFKSLNKEGKMIINLDDQSAPYFLNFEAQEKIGYGIDLKFKALLMIQAKNCQVKQDGLSFRVNEFSFDLSLLGQFNIYNALAAMTIAFAQGYSLKLSKKALERIKKIEGRMEEIKQGQNFRIFVDLAHTPDSFKQVFKLVKQLSSQRIISVFGSAGGGRDKWKRPRLGQLAGQYSDIVVLTNEDPYDENPSQIISDIEQGLDPSTKYKVILDRRQAIAWALKAAKPEDIVLILGKGTEAFLIIGSQEIPWDDRKVVKEELRKIK